MYGLLYEFNICIEYCLHHCRQLPLPSPDGLRRSPLYLLSVLARHRRWVYVGLAAAAVVHHDVRHICLLPLLKIRGHTAVEVVTVAIAAANVSVGGAFKGER